MENLKDLTEKTGFIYKNDTLFSVDGKISEWEKNRLLEDYGIKDFKEEQITNLVYRFKASEINRILNKDIDFDELEKNIFYLHFDYENGILKINDKKIKVVKDVKREYTYKVMKRSIKAIDGLKGLAKHIIKSSPADAVFNSRTFTMLYKAYEYAKAA